jgi:ATP-dependent helicase/nuclease subunit B
VNKVTLFIAPLGARKKRERIFNELVSLCPENDYAEVLYIGPNSSFLSSIKKLFYSYMTGQGNRSSYIPFYSATIQQIGADLYETHGKGELISNEIRTLILLNMLKEQNLGYARLLSGLQNKIKHYILDSSLTEIMNKLDQLIVEEKAKDRALNALKILKAYEDLMHANKLSDTESMLKDSMPLINKHISPAITVIDGFIDPTPLEMQIISAIINKSENVLILAEENTPLANKRINDMQLNATKLKAVAKRKTCGYYAYPSIEDEVDGIAKNVKKLLLDNKMPWDITVSCPVLSKYLPMVKRVFKRHGIPVNAEEQTLSASKPLIAINELLSCLDEDYPRNDFLSVLTSPLFPAIPPQTKEQAVSLSYSAGIIKGKESWLAIEKTIINESSNISDSDRQNLSEFQMGVKNVIDIIENMNHAQNIAAFIDAFENVTNRLGLFDALEKFDEGITTNTGNQINRQLAALRRFASIYEPALNSTVAPGYYIRFLLENLNVSASNPNGVRVVSFDQASIMETEELFCGGMIEGDFPSRPAIDPILPEQVKKALGIPYLEYYLSRQHKYFHRLLNISESSPYFSCPTAEGDKIFLPSPFLDWDQTLRPVEWNIFSEEEVCVREGSIEGQDSSSTILWSNKMPFNSTALNFIKKTTTGYFNVTDLDFYRKCPMRFYIEKVLQTEIDEPPQFEVEARLWGSLAHRVMEQLFKEGYLEITAIENRLFQCLDTSLKQFPIDNFWGKVARKIFQKLLPKLKELESNIRMQGYRPMMVEKKLTAEVDGLKLKGKIDRVDVMQGANAQRDKGTKKYNNDSDIKDGVILLDYKTGNIDSDSLQMALYALIWQENFPEPVDKLGYYSLKEGKIFWYPKKDSMNDYINKAFITAEGLVNNIRNGHFPPEPFKATECRYCNHSPMCQGSG